MIDVDVEIVEAHLEDFPELGALRDLLSEDERKRADAYKVPEPRNAFILARGLLRAELAARLDLPATALAFEVRPLGKPDLRPPGAGRTDWRFSVSHTGPHVAIALVRGLDVGIDIERADRAVDPLGIATRYFTHAENRALAALPEADQSRAFFAGWTRKEAIVKARGTTMSESLQTLAVDIDPETAEPNFEDAGPSRGLRPCRLASFGIAPHHLIGAVAVLSRDRPRLRFSVRSQRDVRLAFVRL